jgi:iron complex outermembrane receptor protein
VTAPARARFSKNLTIALVISAATFGRVSAQDTTTLPVVRDTATRPVPVARPTTLDPVIVSVTRGLGTSSLNAPFAVTVLQPDSVRPGQRHTALDESLSLVPGLTAVSRTNPSQDPRISIRGFGARSAFGVRGVRVLRDGMPLTLPDGQTPVDYLSLESVGRIEVIRGAASALYGNASGGVIDLRTAAPPPARLAGDVRQWLGSDGLSRTTLVGGGFSGAGYYQADASLTRGDGYRKHSRQRATSLFARTGVVARGTDYALSVLGLDMPLAENPGALTRAQLESDPSLADQPSVNKAARKVVRQIQVGLSATHRFTHDDVTASAFVGGRSLYNPLTFAVVDVGRRTYGASARVAHESSIASRANRLTGGFDFQSQNDSRGNFTNCMDSPPLKIATTSCPIVGAERGVITLDQRELVSASGVYLNDELPIAPRFTATAGLRADNVAFEVRDRLIGNGNPDDSGRRTLQAVTPYTGFVSRISENQSAYVNVSTAFETPTATELGNHPDGSAGINQDLNPQRSVTYEAGMKGLISSGVHYDFAAFSTRVKDELVPFEIPGSGGRRYFRNAGRTNRGGGEAALGVGVGPVLFNTAYSYSNFRFARYATDSSNFDGKRIPGIPVHRLQSSATFSRNPVFAVIELEAASSTFVDDGNTARAPGYGVMHVRAGTNRLVGSPWLSLIGGVQNFFDRRYSPSLSVNAARGKFFEPAAGRTLYLGVSAGYGR